MRLHFRRVDPRCDGHLRWSWRGALEAVWVGQEGTVEGDGALSGQFGSTAVVKTVSGVIRPMPECRCEALYQVKKAWQCARASSIDPKHAGKSGRYLSVLNCGLGIRDCHRRREGGYGWVLATSRSTSSAATGLDRMLVPRSACRVRQLGAMYCLAAVSAISFSRVRRSRHGAIIQPTT